MTGSYAEDEPVAGPKTRESQSHVLAHLLFRQAEDQEFAIANTRDVQNVERIREIVQNVE